MLKAAFHTKWPKRIPVWRLFDYCGSEWVLLLLGRLWQINKVLNCVPIKRLHESLRHRHRVWRG
ncbi:hypothetical protein CZ787_11750 [Halomonas citrativorans]|uniref:Uncharacterized protein n=1 Tax=Halomonas citrativorans TaxID=2742612 RepID=A0A1R4I1L1_9GAMM|nr:hypothetical protein CZ787_11750 [Halomonas citrativorans]